MPTALVERRAHSRVPYTGHAYLTYNGRCRTEEVVDLSPDGLQIKSSVRLKAGRRVKIFVPLPHGGGWRLCLLKGEVVRRTKGRLGIALTAGETDTRALLGAFVADR